MERGLSPLKPFTSIWINEETDEVKIRTAPSTNWVSHVCLLYGRMEREGFIFLCAVAGSQVPSRMRQPLGSGFLWA